MDVIEWTGEPPRLPLTRAAEGRGQLAEALAGYREAAAAFDSAGPLAAAELQYLQARTLGKLALNDPARRAEAGAALAEFTAARPDHHRTDPALQLLAEVRAAAGDEAGARGTGPDEVLPQPGVRHRRGGRRRPAGPRRRRRGRRPRRLRPRFAADAEGAVKLDAQIGRAAALVRLNRNAEALEAVDAVLAAEGAGDDTMARAYVRRGDALQATGETKPAILAYLHVDVLYPGAAAAHAESLFHLARLWAAAGLPGRAAEAAAKLRADYPNSDWTARLSAG